MFQKVFLFLFKTIVLYLLLIGFAWGVSDSLIFLPPQPGYLQSEKHIIIKSPSILSNQTNDIIAQYRINPAATYTILYNHGNAVDLSGLKNLQKNFYDHNYSVFIYDYSGYGLSSGQPSEQQVYNDSQAAYNYLINKAGIKHNKIIIYGHSLGSAVAANLALNNPSASLILESPFTSAFRIKTIYPIVPFDKFSTIEKLPEIYTPLLIMHSTDDSIIPVSHSKMLFEVANNPKQSIWFTHAGHTQITHQGKAYWEPLGDFIQSH